MNNTLVFQDLAVVIAAQHQDPKVLSPEFLSYSGIVPADWQVVDASPPNERGSLIRYQNGVAVAANPQQVQIVQPFQGNPSEAQVPKMALRYVEILNNLTFRAVGINFRSTLDLGENSAVARDYVLKLLNFSNFSTPPTRAVLNLTYKFERNVLNLSIQDAMNRGEQGETAIILFTGNCETLCTAESSEERLTQIQQSLRTWETDLAKYTTIVTDFLR
jgi:hypothetical protein